ncbi:MAG: alpha-E domain-containing protein, partial [Sphingomonas sp.]
LLRLYASRQSEAARQGLVERRVAQLLQRVGVDVTAAHPATGLLKLSRAALSTASRIRDRFSPDGWRTLSEIVDLLDDATQHGGDEDLIALTSQVMTRLSGFTGLVRENMYQVAGWRFMKCGRRIERGAMTAAIAAAVTAGEVPEGAFEVLLEFTDSRVTYRRRYTVTLSRETVLDLTVLDPANPRSVAYQVNSLKRAIGELPGVVAGETLDQLARRIARLQVRLATAGPTEVDEAFLQRVAGDFSDLSDLLTQRYFASDPGETVERFDHE